MVFAPQNLGCWQDISLLLFFFSINQTQKATKEVAYCIPKGGVMQKEAMN